MGQSMSEIFGLMELSWFSDYVGEYMNLQVGKDSQNYITKMSILLYANLKNNTQKEKYCLSNLLSSPYYSPGSARHQEYKVKKTDYALREGGKQVLYDNSFNGGVYNPHVFLYLRTATWETGAGADT